MKIKKIIEKKHGKYLQTFIKNLQTLKNDFVHEDTLVDAYINTMQTTCLSKFGFQTSFFQITSLQVSKEKLSIESFFVSMFLCIQAVYKISVNKI